MKTKVILVDKNDRPIGEMEKLEAHKEGRLHRAFSIFVFNSKGEWLLQKRAKGKYHSGGLWTNTCCSHPRVGETLKKATHRRLQEEMGFDCPLKETFQFTYRFDFPNGLTEHEYDHVFMGMYDGQPRVNPKEADDWCWLDQAELIKDLGKKPGKYTP